MSPPENNRIRLTIIVVAHSGGDSLSRNLSAFKGQIANEKETEVIIVTNFDNQISEIKDQYSFAEFQTVSPETTIPQMRSLGISRARGETIALLEDNCIPDSDWHRAVTTTLNLPHAAIGGAIENASIKDSLGWAIYFFDYGKYMLPFEPQISENLSGLNVWYKREILEKLKSEYKSGFYESSIHQELKKRGHKLYREPTAIVRHDKIYAFKNVCWQFFHQSRSFAARRTSKANLPVKLFLIAASPSLPVLIIQRIVWQTVGKKRHLWELLKSFPVLLILVGIWSFGEFSGYLTGAGESERHWR